jgi:hypothetical protein
VIVQTETAAYVLEGCHKGILTRYPREGNHDYDVAQLRMDGERIPYQVVGEITVGERVQFLLEIRDDGVLTHRTTTPVVSISD